MKRCILPILAILIMLTLCACKGTVHDALPVPLADAESMFAVDANINMETIDQYLDREDVAYRDVRMLFDPADYAAIGGEADLTRTIEGFLIVPFPYVATLQALPVDNAYQGNTLYTVEWNADGSIVSASPNYIESELFLSDLFPRDKAIFLMCGGGGYAGMMKTLLIYLGYDESLLYNIGGNWTYTGENVQELIVYPEDADDDLIHATWRADYAYFDFSLLHPIEGR